VQSQPVGALNVPPIALNELDNLIPLLTSRLSEEQHREDLGSSIALAQTMAHLKDPEPIDDSLIDWMADAARGRPFPVELHVRALLMACGRRRDPAFVKDVVKALDQNSATFRSPAPVARVLEAIALLDQFELIEANATDIARLTEQICGELRRFAELPDRGWISAESTGHIALGLVALYRALPLEWTEERSELAGHIATAAAALNRGRSAYQRGPKGVAVLARTIQALIVIDQWFPLGLQRFTSLEWPGGTSVGSGDRVERELTQHLAIQNEHLRQAQRDAESRLHELEGQLRERRIPTYVGQATATLLPTLALFAATWFVIQAIGWDSIAGLIANLAVVLSILVTVLAGLYGILARRRLLLTPADRLREWVATIGLPAIRDAGKVKRQ
jgi:hypothetical protein